MNAFQLKQALQQGKRVYGTMVTAPAPRWVEYLRTSGIDFVFIDTEHIPLDRAELTWMCQVFSASDIAPIVRVSSPNPYEACQALDSGAAGIVFPYVETMEQVRTLQGAVRYRPLKGDRLEQVLQDPGILTEDEKTFFESYNADKLMIINCESVAGIRNLEQMIQVSDLDAVFIGPHDLSVNLGVPEQYDSPAFLHQVEEIIRICRKNHVSVGNHFSVDLEKQINWAKLGMNIVLWNIDILRFVQAMKNDISIIRNALGEEMTDSEGSAVHLDI